MPDDNEKPKMPAADAPPPDAPSPVAGGPGAKQKPDADLKGAIVIINRPSRTR